MLLLSHQNITENHSLQKKTQFGYIVTSSQYLFMWLWKFFFKKWRYHKLGMSHISWLTWKATNPPDWWSWQHRMPGLFPQKWAENRTSRRAPGPMRILLKWCWQLELKQKQSRHLVTNAGPHCKQQTSHLPGNPTKAKLPLKNRHFSHYKNYVCSSEKNAHFPLIPLYMREKIRWMF